MPRDGRGKPYAGSMLLQLALRVPRRQGRGERLGCGVAQGVGEVTAQDIAAGIAGRARAHATSVLPRERCMQRPAFGMPSARGPCSVAAATSHRCDIVLGAAVLATPSVDPTPRGAGFPDLRRGGDANAIVRSGRSPGAAAAVCQVTSMRTVARGIAGPGQSMFFLRRARACDLRAVIVVRAEHAHQSCSGAFATICV